MITNPDAVTVLCYGDSNTNGQRSEEFELGRLPADRRWTGLLQAELGDGCSVIEEGLGGRTADLDYPETDGYYGRDYLLPCLHTHVPLDVVVLMLGTNDVKIQFDRSPEQIVAAVAGLLDDLAEHAIRRDDTPSAVVLLAPAPVEPSAPRFAELNSDAYDEASAARSRQLAPLLRGLAADRGVVFADVADVAEVGADGVHLSERSHPALAGLVAGLVRDCFGR